MKIRASHILVDTKEQAENLLLDIENGVPFEDLAKEYGVPGLGACPMMKEGQVFYADYAKPDGFCDEAWKAVYQYVFALSHGTGDGLFYYGDWIGSGGL